MSARVAAKRKVRLFVCVKTRADGKACCAGRGSRELLEAIRAELLLRGATAGAIDVRPVGCMDQCEHGPAMVAYSGAAAEESEPPEGVRRIFVWAAKRYKGVKSGDVVGICDGLVRIARG